MTETYYKAVRPDLRAMLGDRYEVLAVLDDILPNLLAKAWDQGLWAEQLRQEPCLLHDNIGEDVPGWEMAECTCENLTNPYRQEQR